MKRITVGLLALIFTMPVFSLGYGIYNSPFDKYLQGYEFNMLSSFPTTIRYFEWDGEEWAENDKTHYVYERDGEGRVRNIESVSSSTGTKTIYRYGYEGKEIISVQKELYQNHEAVPTITTKLVITRNAKEIVEEYSENQVYKRSIVYVLDYSGRIHTIESNSISTFSGKLRRDFLWEIEYIGESKKIKNIKKTGSQNKVLPSIEYDYSEKLEIQNSSDGQKLEIEYLNDRLSSIKEVTPSGEFYQTMRIFNYDKNNIIKEYEILHRDKIVGNSNNKTEDRMYIFEH